MATVGRIVLDYGDYLIRESEMKILRGPHWLNDVIIGFYIDYLRLEVFPEEELKMRIFGPEMTQLLKICGPDDLKNLLGDVSDYQFLFFPVNNSDDPEQMTSGGSHWSLLVYSRTEAVMAHFDSSFGMNGPSAELLYHQLARAIRPTPTFQSRGCAAQENGHDCGLHVLANIECIVTHIMKSKVLNGVHTAKPDAANKLRTKIYELIEKKTKSSGDKRDPQSK